MRIIKVSLKNQSRIIIRDIAFASFLGFCVFCWLLNQSMVNASELPTPEIVKNGVSRGVEQAESKYVIQSPTRQYEVIEKEAFNRDFVQNYRNADKPIQPYISIFESYGLKGKLALAICGAETAFGTVGDRIGEHNCFGWQAYLGNNWENNIQTYMQKADGYLSIYDGSVESIVRIADAGYYPTNDGEQMEWAYRVQWFYNNL